MAHDEQDFVDGWQTYSNWIDDIRDENKIIGGYDVNDNFKERLMSCMSNTDRFKILWNDQNIRKELESIYQKDFSECRKVLKKSAQESAKQRDLGNKSFKNGNYLDALAKYTQAVRFAPYPDKSNGMDQSLALALANRSAALYSLTRYRLCLLDIQLAQTYGYPEANMFKLLIRRIKCLHILSVWANDSEEIKSNLRKMMTSKETKEYVKVEIQNMFEFIEQTQPEDMEKDDIDVMDETTMKISNSSRTVAQATDCVEMSCDPDKGRYLLTNKDVTFGRALIVEEPFVCNLHPSKWDTYCYNCFGQLHMCGLSCKTCTQVHYCSQDCMMSDEKVHRYECNGLIGLQEKIGVAYLVAHIMYKVEFKLNSKFPVYSRKSCVEKTVDALIAMSHSDWPDLTYKNNYASVLGLMDHASDYDYDGMMCHCLTSVYLTIAFVNQFSAAKTNNYLANEHMKDDEFLIHLGSIILRHLLQLQTNLISILSQNLQGLVSSGHSISELEEKPIGVGLYPTICLLNHACSPNILSIFNRNKFVARAAKNLECGTEINYCYGPSVSRMSKRDRQVALKQQYFFTCNCHSCSNNIENESRALLCPKCSGPVVYNRDHTNSCITCKETAVVNVKSHLANIDRLDKELAGLRQSIPTAASLDLIKSIENVESELSKLVYWKHNSLVQIRSDLLDCAETLDDLALTLKYCQAELDLIKRIHGDNSYESLMVMLKFINYQWQDLYYKCEQADTKPSKELAVANLRGLATSVVETRAKLRDLLSSTNILGAESSYEQELKFLSDILASISKYLKQFEE